MSNPGIQPRDIPVIFSAPMVRALLDDQKTQTRRLAWRIAKHTGKRMPSPWQKVKAGDLLWVRETWTEEHPLAVQAGRSSMVGNAGIPGPPPVDFRVIYRADGEPLQIWRTHDGEWPYYTVQGPVDNLDALCPAVASNFTRDGKAVHWNSPLHLPREFSRITLEVKAVKLEPLQAISEADAQAEGCRGQIDNGIVLPSEQFADLWRSLHGETSWAENPDVVAPSFIVHKQNIDAFKMARAA